MSKAVLYSIRPEYCKLILDGKKTVEVRKSIPKLDVPFKCYIYCTYGFGLIEYKDEVIPNFLLSQKVSENKKWDNCCNGKVIAEFVCDYIIGHCEMANADIAEQRGCIKREKLFEYANGKELYGLHISDLFIYNEPKELSEFTKPYGTIIKAFDSRYIQKPPQSWCYVEELSGA